KYYQARGCELRPRGPRPGGPPILIGAKGPRMLRFAATYADLWNAEGPMRRPEEIIPLRASGDAACAEVGRDPSTLGRSASVAINIPMTQAQSVQRSSTQGEQPEPTSPEDIAEMLRSQGLQPCPALADSEHHREPRVVHGGPRANGS